MTARKFLHRHRTPLELCGVRGHGAGRNPTIAMRVREAYVSEAYRVRAEQVSKHLGDDSQWRERNITLTLSLPTAGISHGGPFGRRTRPEAAHAAPKVPW